MTHISDNLLNEYLDGALETAVYEQVSAHLAGCEACRVRLAKGQQLFAALDSVPEVPLMVDLSRQVMNRLTAELKPRPLPRWMSQVVAIQMVTALALFVWLWPVMGSAMETAESLLPQSADQMLPSVSLSQLLDPLSSTPDLLSDWGQTLEQTLSQIFSPGSSLPILEGFLIIGLALVFWLAGSGLLLRQSLLLQNKS